MITAAVLLLCLMRPQRAEAFGVSMFGIPIFHIGEHVTRVQKLPKEPSYTMKSDKKDVHVDIGIYHKRFAVLGIPLLNWGRKQYVLYHKGFFGGTQYSVADVASLNQIGEAIGFELPTEPKLPYWNRWGGKLLLLALIVGFFWLVTRADDNIPSGTTASPQSQG